MADSKEGKTNFQTPDLLVPTLIPLLFGLVIHLFIIIKNVNDWWKGRPVTSVDHIVTSLGISRMCAQFANTLYVFEEAFFQHSQVTLVILRVYDLFFYSNIWFTTLLFTVFCLKISNFNIRLFLYLRRMIEHRTVHLIVACGLLASVVCSMPLWNVLSSEIYNTTMKNQFMSCPYIKSPIHFTVASSIPILFYFISSILLFSSLYHHTVKMKKSGNLSINLETYYSAMKLVSVTFMYNTMYFSGYLFCVFYYDLYCVNLGWIYIVLDVLPSLHSSYLIYRTAKLRSQMSEVLHNIIVVILRRKGAETNSTTRR